MTSCEINYEHKFVESNFEAGTLYCERCGIMAEPMIVRSENARRLEMLQDNLIAQGYKCRCTGRQPNPTDEKCMYHHKVTLDDSQDVQLEMDDLPDKPVAITPPHVRYVGEGGEEVSPPKKKLGRPKKVVPGMPAVIDERTLQCLNHNCKIEYTWGSKRVDPRCPSCGSNMYKELAAHRLDNDIDLEKLEF